MTSDPQTLADSRYSEAVASTGARDPREFYREMLRTLRERSEAEYAEAVAGYQEGVVRGIAERGIDPLEAWLAFGVELAGRVHPGRAVVIDSSGRAAPFSPPPRWEALILHLPEARGVRAIPVSIPPRPSDAQKATLDLLVRGKLKLG